MTERLILGACFIGVCTWLISWAIGRWADREVQRHQDEVARSQRFRKLSPEAPRAAGFNSRRVS